MQPDPIMERRRSEDLGDQFTQQFRLNPGVDQDGAPLWEDDEKARLSHTRTRSTMLGDTTLRAVGSLKLSISRRSGMSGVCNLQVFDVAPAEVVPCACFWRWMAKR